MKKYISILPLFLGFSCFAAFALEGDLPPEQMTCENRDFRGCCPGTYAVSDGEYFVCRADPNYDGLEHRCGMVGEGADRIYGCCHGATEVSYPGDEAGHCEAIVHTPGDAASCRERPDTC